MKYIITTTLALLVTSGLFISSANAQQNSNEHSHDSGFFLRLSAGPGWAQTSEETTSLEMSGFCLNYNFAIGGIISPAVAIHATLFGWTVESPEVSIGGTTRSSDNVTLTKAAIGIGVTWYHSPTNIYLSPSLGLALLNLKVAGFVFESEPGLALDLTAGKEWWVSSSWGLGVAGSLGVHSIANANQDADQFTGWRIAVRFSATYN